MLLLQVIDSVLYLRRKFLWIGCLPNFIIFKEVMNSLKNENYFNELIKDSNSHVRNQNFDVISI